MGRLGRGQRQEKKLLPKQWLVKPELKSKKTSHPGMHKDKEREGKEKDSVTETLQ